MRKDLVIYITVSFLILIENAIAVDCMPTVSWRIDPQFYIGETGKLVATINNGCNKTFDVKTEVNAERTEGYIKVYKVQTEYEIPRPKTHSTIVGLSYAYTSLEKFEKVNVVYFIQPDEQALPGSYVLFENFYVEDKLKESKETKITVSKSVTVTYQIPSQLQLNKPTLLTLTINNMGTEIITSLKVCLSSTNNAVSFSESCKSWTNIPSKFTDKFTVYINGLIPGTYQGEIKVKTDYTTFTGLDVSETYNQTSLKIAAVQSEKPSLTYKPPKSINGSLTFEITNGGNGIAYDCVIKLATPANCFINSSDIANYTRVSILNPPAENTYLIGCSDLILPSDESITTINFDPSQITPPCSISGSILYKDSLGEAHETKISKFNLIEVAVTTLPGNNVEKGKNNIWFILIITIVAIAIILVVFKVQKVRNFLSEKISKIIQRLSKLINKNVEEQKNKE